MAIIEGTVEEIIYANESNGYTVCDINHKNELITAVGYMPFVGSGENLKITGKWVVHPDYGEQLKVEMYEKIMPKTVQAIEKYLGSGVIKGVREATAKKIVDKFGEKSLDIIRFSPEKLAEIKGISINKAVSIGHAFERQRGLTEVIMFLQEYGISPAYSTRIYKQFGEDTLNEIKANPYRMADEIFGIGFKTVDRIAMNIGIDPLSKYRICSGIKYVLSKSAGNGHTFLPRISLKEYTSALLEVGIENIEDALVKLAIDESIYVEKNEIDDRIYLSAFYKAEAGTCKKLIELAHVDFINDISDMEEKLMKVQKQQRIILAERQKLAIKEAVNNGVMVITGGPGTGKTTIIKCIIKLLQKSGCKVALAAPTGRAAKRMSEATGFNAKTIHRLLEIGYSEDDELIFTRTENNPLETDAVIIDEMSMVDILLMYNLVKSIPVGCRLIMVGDVDQLPSVGPGNVLKDIINSGILKTVQLTEIYRQAKESMITVNAHRINRGEYPYLNIKDRDFFLMKRSTGNSIIDTILELCARRLPDRYGYDPVRDIQVLTPTRKGITGVANLNIEMQKILNPPGKDKKEKIISGIVYREGDRVMQNRNNYKIQWVMEEKPDVTGTGIFNGDMGTILEINNKEQKMSVLFDDNRISKYDFTLLDELETAYAVTIHKSQGSEFPVMVMPVFKGPPILMTRNLLYTAVTRARDLVVMIGSERYLYNMVLNRRENLRYSGLDEKLVKCADTDIDW